MRILGLSAVLSVFLGTSFAQAMPCVNGEYGTRLTLEELVETARKQGTLDATLAELPAGYRGLTALLYRSRGLAASFTDFQTPRFIAFGCEPRNGSKQTNEVILTFSGVPNAEGKEILEVMEFDRERAEFRFHELEFGPGKTVQLRKDPPKCLSCHGQPARPLWDTWPLWPGAYGSVADQALKGSREDLELEKFIRQELPRKPYSRFSDLLGRRYEFAQATPAQSIEENLSTWWGGSGVNHSLDQSFAAMMTQKIHRDILSSPDYERYRYVLNATLYQGCYRSEGFPESFIPEELRKTFSRSYASLLKDTREAQEAYHRAKLKRQEGMNLALPARSNEQEQTTRRIAAFRYLFENRGLKTVASWSMTLERSFAMDGRRDLKRIVPIDSELMKDPLWKPVPLKGFSPENLPAHQSNCELLKRRSLEALAR